MCLRLLIADDGITQRDLAKAMYVAPPTLTKMLRSMEEAGLVRRVPTRRRPAHQVELSGAGRAEEGEGHAAAADARQCDDRQGCRRRTAARPGAAA